MPKSAWIGSRRALLSTALFGMAVGALINSCANPSPTPAPLTNTPTTPTATLASAQPTLQPMSTAANVSLEVKIGQMIMAGFRGLTAQAASTILTDIRERHLGSVVLFDYDVPSQTPVRNIESPLQVTALIRDLQAAAPIPLLVAIDQEGGVIRRLKETQGFPPTVSHQFLGTKNDLQLTEGAASAMAQTLAQVGVNLNLAPVVDLNVNPNNPIIGKYERSFSPDPQIVTAHARAFIHAHHAQSVLCTLKHFPGHGSSTADSHLGIVDVTKTWTPTELEPYQTLIQEGEVDAILTAHVFTPLDPEYPATLSAKTLTAVLRQQLGYNGVIISDDMQMGAITTQYGFAVALEKAINAGVDLLALSNNGESYNERLVEETVSVIQQLVETGKVSEERIDEAYQRIQGLKQRLQ